MKYWLTTHWPHRIDSDKNTLHEGVHIPNGRENSVKQMQEGDFVFIYESKSGRPEKRKLITGDKIIVPCYEGKEGIVVLAKIITRPYELEDTEPKEYSDGSSIWWRYYAETEIINSHGFIPRNIVNRIIGYEENYNFRGFGSEHSGVKELSEEEYNLLLKEFTKNYDKEIIAIKENSKINSTRNNSVPEGEIHKKLKELISANPSKYLDEMGIELIEIEHSFITGDRVDILLQDKCGRFIVVEVEPECKVANHIGTAQCMKYRSLMAFESNRFDNEIRALLVATKIAKDVNNKAKKYNIEVKEISI